MAAAYASLVSLINVIHDLQHHPSPPISLDKQLLESITPHITFFLDFLQSYSSSSPPPVSDDDEEAVDPLEMRIAAAAYAAEDAIESHIVKTIQQQRSSAAGPKLISLLNCFRPPKVPNTYHGRLQTVIEQMDSIKKVVVDTEKKKSQVVHDQVPVTNNVLASVAGNETMVGSGAVLLEIMEKLTGGGLDLQVIPIEGMGGIGKTFLATSIYARPLIKDHFDICAWATISQQYNAGEILCDLLSQATSREKVKLSGKSVDELGLQLHKHLFRRRFVIVMDDMWSIDAWDKIQCYFPNNENGSRVLVTTRLSQLCSQLNNDYSLRMSFLDESSSWALFSTTVFGENSCPPELKKIGEKIVENCRGLPLSIAVVGGLLKKMNNTRGSWESIRNNLSSVVNMENDKHCLRLLKLSYNHLPVYLKPCFLYMGVLEEDKEIRVSTLVKLWVSEGFIKPTNGEALETTARGFSQDLIDRNLILIGKLGRTGSIKFCKIHDLVRDMCLKEGKKEGFYHVIGQCNPPQGTNNQRRVVIPRNTSKKKVCGDLISMSYARSVIFENGEVPPFLNLGFLRTLHANNYSGERYNGGRYVVNFLRFQHVNIRHLAIKGIPILSFQQVSFFWNLQTVILSHTYKHKSILLADFWKMPQLRHIEIDAGFLFVPDLLSDGRDDDDAVVMENLHTLKGVRNMKVCEEVVKRIPNIKKLKLEYYTSVEWNLIKLCFVDNIKHEYCFGNIEYLCRLESLSIFAAYDFTHDEYNKLTFPHSLKKLSLWFNMGFKWEDGILEKIGSLPLLEKLTLRGGCFGKGKWETMEGQFLCLKYLELDLCRGLEHWTTAEEGSNILPRLEHLCLYQLYKLKKIPCELGNIDTLKRIELSDCEEGAVMSAKEIVDEQVELQGGEDQLSFHVHVKVNRGNQRHLLSLASSNFEVIPNIILHHRRFY